jgi:hypothetical protein
METESIQERNRKKAEYWTGHINKWKESGLKQVDYCRANNLSRQRFTYWKSKDNRKRKSPKFIPVIPKPTSLIPEKTSPLKIHVGGKFCIEVGEGFSEETLTRLIKTISVM